MVRLQTGSDSIPGQGLALNVPFAVEIVQSLVVLQVAVQVDNPENGALGGAPFWIIDIRIAM
jgi:hypothetical protein